MSSTESQMGEAALAFRDLTLSSGDRLLLHNVTGFVPRGGITAVLGILVSTRYNASPHLACYG